MWAEEGAARPPGHLFSAFVLQSKTDGFSSLPGSISGEVKGAAALHHQPPLPWIAPFRKTMMSSHKGMGESIFGVKILTEDSYKSSHWL